MDGVATPIIGRPRPLPGHDTPNPAYHPHTLNYEEPVKTMLSPLSLMSSGGSARRGVGARGYETLPT